MATNKLSYQTNFSGIKYNNNPLGIDINSFSNANNVYLNKYGALISRPPIEGQTFPDLAYTDEETVPIELKIVGTYDLSNGGLLYIIWSAFSADNCYIFRYRQPNGTTYEEVLYDNSITTYNDFALVQYKQYYILFNKAGAMALDTTTADNSWTELTNFVDVPVTSIQTGNEILSLPANQLTDRYKTQFILKPDSDDTIYALPTGEATVTFPSQTSVTYDMPTANEYTRDRVLRRLTTPAHNTANALVSMVLSGERIAIAEDDRFALSLDYGDTFQTIPYPTSGGPDYKNTASLSDDGQCFFYVHSDGVYRYMIGDGDWECLEVVLDYSYSYSEAGYLGLQVEYEVQGKAINTTTKGANYCHFVNPEKFAVMLAHYDETTEDWWSALYVKGTNITNLFDQDLESGADFVNSFVTQFNYDTDEYEPINVITDIDEWVTEPYLNRKTVRIFDNDTVAFYDRDIVTSGGTATVTGLILKSVPTHLYAADSPTTIVNLIAPSYVTITVHNQLIPAGGNVHGLRIVIANQLEALVTTGVLAVWYPITYSLTYTEDTTDTYHKYNITFTVTEGTEVAIGDSTGASYIHRLTYTKYLADTTAANALLVQKVDDVTANDEAYTLPLEVSVTSKVVVSGANYLIYDATTEKWYTNIPMLTTLTYTYLDGDEFKQVPTAFFDDQNLWLGMGNTLWIGSLVDNKISIPGINNNVFSKNITAIHPISAVSKAIFFSNSISLCEEITLSDNSVAWQYHPLKFTVGVRRGDTVITTTDGKLTIFPTRYGLAALTYQIDIAATEQAITYLSDDIKSLWSEFYTDSSAIQIMHHNTQLILANGTNQLLIYDFRTNGWYPLTFPEKVKISRIQPNSDNYEILELQPSDASLTSLTGIYHLNKEHDELYTYATPYKDLGTLIIPWHLTSQLLLLEAPNHYKNISQLIIDQVDSDELEQSAHLVTQLFRQRSNLIKPSIELIYNIDTFAKIIKKVNWWKVLGLKWQLENDSTSSYPTQLRLYNVSIQYTVSYEVK